MGMITIAFDDGYRETFEACAGFLAEKGVRATFAVPASLIGKTLENRPVMDRTEIESLIKNGHEIASHTLTHPNLLDLFNAEGEAAVRNEMKNSKAILGSMFDVEVDSMVFPFIKDNQDLHLRGIAAEYYRSSRITTENAAFNRLPVHDPYSVIGVALTRKVPMENYNKLVDIAGEEDIWLIEVFHYVSDKNTKSANRDEEYRFFTHVDAFKTHIEYVLSKKIPILDQKEVIKYL